MNTERSNNGESTVLSVIVVAFNGAALLRACLSALLAQPDCRQIEIHVISKQPEPGPGFTDAQTAPVHWHRVAGNETIPQMRRIGIMQAKTVLLALLEDDCVVGPRWLQSTLAAHRAGHSTVGGAVEPGGFSNGLDWGVFYCEFARFLAPFSGTVGALPGNNVSYASNMMDPALFEHGFYEVFVHDQWQKSGNTLFAAKGMVVKNNNSWQLANCTSDAFHHGRSFAGQRFGNRFSIRRLLYCLLAPLLPVVKSFRTIVEIHSRKRTDLPLARALPWIIVFHSFWSAGELIGYLAGPGTSIEKWR